MTSEAPTLESIRADIEAKIAKARSDVAPLTAAVKSAEDAIGKAAIAHAKTPDLMALVEASGKHSEAKDALEAAQAIVKREENRLANAEKDAQREADRATVLGLVKKADAMVAPAMTAPVSRGWLTVNGAIPVSELTPTKAESEMALRWDIHQVRVATVTGEDGKPALSCSFFGKQKRASGGGGGARQRRTFTDDGVTYSPEEYTRAFADPDRIAKTEAAIADPNKSASFTHLADSVMAKRVAEGHTVTKS